MDISVGQRWNWIHATSYKDSLAFKKLWKLEKIFSHIMGFICLWKLRDSHWRKMLKCVAYEWTLTHLFANVETKLYSSTNCSKNVVFLWYIWCNLHISPLFLSMHILKLSQKLAQPFSYKTFQLSTFHFIFW